MTLVRFNPAMPELADIMNNFFDRSPLFSKNDNDCQPAVNVVENNDNYLLEVMAPGFKKENFKVEVNNNVLTISASLNDEQKETAENYRRKEFTVAQFSRSFNLHKERIDDGQIEARYENGILTVVLAKREEAKPKPSRMIEIV
ncbi:MAG: Hsp20 family protein [Breznakibacter sp.]